MVRFGERERERETAKEKFYAVNKTIKLWDVKVDNKISFDNASDEQICEDT